MNAKNPYQNALAESLPSSEALERRGTLFLLALRQETKSSLGKYFNVPGDHFANAGEPLWESVRSPPWVRIVVPLLWAWLLWGLI